MKNNDGCMNVGAITNRPQSKTNVKSDLRAVNNRPYE